MAIRKVNQKSVNEWLRSEAPHHMELLSRLREKLERSLESQVEEDADGRQLVVPADVNESGTPSRDWCRAFQRYSGAYSTLLVEERERAKLALMAKMKGGEAPMTDEEYEAEMRNLAREALAELTTDELHREFLRRGMTIPVEVLSTGDPD